MLGKCFDEHGQLLPAYKSIYLRERIRTHAQPDSPHYSRYECKTCGFVGETSDFPYLLREELSAADVFQSTTACLYLSESLAAEFPWGRFRDLKPVAFPVLDGPPCSASESESIDKRLTRTSAKPVRAVAVTPSSSVKETRVSAEALIARLTPNDAVLVCKDSSGAPGCEYRVPVRTIMAAAAGEGELGALRKLLGDMPGASLWEELYAKHDGIGLFSPLDEVSPAITLLPIGVWLEQKDEMFEWFFDGVKEAFEDMPYGPDDVLPIAALNCSPDRWFLVTSGPNAGILHFGGTTILRWRKRPLPGGFRSSSSG